MNVALLVLCLSLPLQAATSGRSGRSGGTGQTKVPSIEGLQSPLDSPLVLDTSALGATLTPAVSLAPGPSVIPNVSAPASAKAQLLVAPANAQDEQAPPDPLIAPLAEANAAFEQAPARPLEAPKGPQTLTQRVQGILSRIINPFGSSTKAPEGQALESLSVMDHVSYTAKGRAEAGLLVRHGREEVTFAVKGEKGWALKTYAPKKVSGIKTLELLKEGDYTDAALQTKILWSAARRRGAEMEGYRRFKRDQGLYWEQVSDSYGAELAKLRAMSSKPEAKAYLRQVGLDIVERLKKAHGSENLGFHFNLHGGQADEYAEGGGIRATMGDIALNYSMNADRNYKVYFFQSAKHELYDILDTGNPAMVLGGGRMGHVLNIFKLDSEFFKKGLASKALLRMGDISVDFDTDKVNKIPYETYIAPPMEIFLGLGKKTGQGRLSRDEETLAAMRYIEAVSLAEPRYVP